MPSFSRLPRGVCYCRSCRNRSGVQNCVGMGGVNVSSHKRRGPNDAIAHHTPTLKVPKWALTRFPRATCHSEFHMVTATKKNKSWVFYLQHASRVDIGSQNSVVPADLCR